MTRYGDRPRDFAFMGWVKTQRCRVAVEIGTDYYCWSGVSEADHAGFEPGLSMKCDDRETIPLCHLHHRHKTDGTGYFDGWGRERLRAWLDAQILIVQAAWDAWTDPLFPF